MKLRAVHEDKPAVHVGVTGHRDSMLVHADVAALHARVDEVLEGIRAATPSDWNGRPVLVSALAEGADRIVAERALALGFALSVLLPFPAHVYESDFANAESVHAFRSLVKRSREIEVVRAGLETTAGPREQAYVRLGHRIVADAAVLVALWDGEPARGDGGTADVVKAASERGLPVVWIDSAKPHEVRAFSSTHPPTVVPPPVQSGVEAVVAPCLLATP